MTGREEWRAVVGFEGRYEVSSLGRVRTLLRAGRIKAQWRLGNYFAVQIGRAGKRTVHSLVAEAFIGPRPAGLEVRHRNGNALDNRAANLTYGTRAENAQDAVRHGTHRRAVEASRALRREWYWAAGCPKRRRVA